MWAIGSETKARKHILRSPFFWKLYAGYVVLIVLCASIVSLMVVKTVERAALGEIEGSLRAQAALLEELAASALAGREEESLQRRLRRLRQSLGTRLTVIRRNGAVIADSDGKPEAVDDHSRRPEIEAARARGEGVAVRMSTTVKKPMMYLALPVEAEGETLGFVRASLPLTAIEERLSSLRRVIWAGAALTALLALIPGFAVAHRLVAPLVSMTQAAQAIAAGAYDERVAPRRRDELGRLGRAFNLMAAQLQSRVGTIAAERNRLAAILTSMVEGVIAVDRSENVIHMNTVAARLLGADREESIGHPIWEIARRHEISQALTDVLRSGEGGGRELRFTAGAEEKTLEVRLSPLRDAAGRVTGAIMVLHDISDLKRLEGMRREFVANVSHEIKTPVTAIRALVETLAEDREMAPETRERFLSKLSGQATRLSALVGDLLTLSRLESGEERYARERLDLRALIEEVAERLEGAGRAKGLVFSLALSPQPLEVDADREALTQAISNLVDNAVKYTDAGGKVSVCLERYRDRAVLEVTDTGVGIPAQHLDRIFERFYTVDRSRSRERGGTGLGLAIVKHVALAHGGSVRVESTPGVGSKFKLVLPLAGAPSAAAPAES